MEEKRDYDKELDKKDSLMWNDEDYQAMEKITGFDEESIEADRKKGMQIIIFVVICLVMLIIGFLLGYNLPKKDKGDQLIINEEVVSNPTIKMAFTKKNDSGELYLYLRDDNENEYSILELSDYSFYKYEYFKNSLYIILIDERMTLYKIDLTKNGYTNNKVNEFVNEYDSNNIYFVDNLIYFIKDHTITLYDINTDTISNFDENITLDNILAINEKYILYLYENKINLFDLKTKEIALIDDSLLQAVFMGDNILYFKENNNRETVLFYEYSIDDKSSNFIAEVEYENAILMYVKGMYLYNDGNKLYSYDGITNNEIYAANTNITEIAYLSDNEIIVIPDSYDSANCVDSNTEVAIINIQNKKVNVKELKGCLETRIINDVIFANND